MNYSLLFITAFAVSVDSFFAGISLKTDAKINYKHLFLIVSVIALMCLIGNLFGKVLKNNFVDNFSFSGGIILVAVGLYDLLFTEKQTKNLIKPTISATESLLVGIAVGIDGCAAVFSLAVMGYGSLIVPTTITVMHFILISLGMTVKNCLDRFAVNLKALSPAILVALGSYKIASSI